MDRETMEKITSAYTVYSLLCPADRIVISIDSFAEIYKTNLAALDTDNHGMLRTGKSDNDSRRHFSEDDAADSLQKGIKSAEATLDNEEKMSAFLDKLKVKMKSLPMVGNVLSNVPTMFKLLNSYFKGEYEDIPRKQLLIIVSALTYLISPIDLIPDLIPVVGLIDDMAVISACIKLTKPELEKYLKWREENSAVVAAEENVE